MTEGNDIRIDNDPEKRVGMRIDNNPDKMNVSEFTNKVKKNPWMIVSAVLGILVIILAIMVFRGGFTGNVIGTGAVVSADEAGANMLEFANTQGANAQLVEVNDDGDFYEVVLSMQGQELPLYVAKDGKRFTQALIPFDVVQQTQQAPPPAIEYSEEDLVKIKELSTCLADNGIKAYGAGWCGYCQKLKEEFGGEDSISPFYIECQNADRIPTESAALCEQENIQGFPTITINGEPYSGARTIEALADTTGCEAPELSA